MPHRRIIYLHGFASSPRSKKACFFSEKLSAEGFSVDIPDLAAGDFEHLTLTGQLRILEELLRRGPAALIGSSLGGYLAALAATRYPEQVEKVILLAPAFGFYDLWLAEMGKEKFEKWREIGTISIFHYGEGKNLPLAFDLMEDASAYEPFPNVRQSGLIFHGVNDAVVPVQQTRRFAAGRVNIQLLEFESGHELTDRMDDMWSTTRAFLVER